LTLNHLIFAYFLGTFWCIG